MRYCGIDVSARRSHQQLVTLHERRAARPDAPAGEVELVATFYDPGPVDAVATSSTSPAGASGRAARRSCRVTSSWCERRADTSIPQ